MKVPTKDQIAFYWFGWKDYSFEYKPVFQVMKEYYQEEWERLFGASEPRIHDQVEIRPHLVPTCGYSSEETEEEDDATTSEDSLEEWEGDHAYYEQAIYKKFSYT